MIGPATIRGRLTLWFAAAMTVVLVLFASGVFAVVRAGLLGEVRDRVRRELGVIAAFVRDNPGDVSELSEFNPDSLVLVLKGDQVELRSTPWERLGLPGPAEVTADIGDWSWETPSDHHYRLAAQTVPTAERTFVVAVAADEEAALGSLATLAWTLAASLPVVLGLSLLGGYALAGRMLSPVRRMAAAAERIGDERLTERLPVENAADEFGRLATVTNRSLDRLQETLDRQRRFTADASHEMRTPLTAIRTAGEVALRREETPHEYRETIGSMLEGVGRLTALIDRLLMLARADAGTHAIRPEVFDAAGIVREVMDLLQAVAEEKEIRVETAAAADGLTANADPVLFRQAIVNVLDNAVKYTPRGGVVRIDAGSRNGSVFVAIRDGGPGIAPEHYARVFERFYRIDTARARGELNHASGAGLGLAIARWAALANGGAITLESEVGKGSTFTVTVPAYPSSGRAGTPRP